jgi:hypothetical protein
MKETNLFKKEVFNFSLDNLTGILNLIREEFTADQNNRTLILVNKIPENLILRKIEDLGWYSKGFVILQLHNNENEFLENIMEKFSYIDFNEFNGVILLDVLQKLNSPQILLNKIKNKKTLIIFPNKFKEISKEVEFSERAFTDKITIIGNGCLEQMQFKGIPLSFCKDFNNCLDNSTDGLVLKSYIGELSNNYIVSFKQSTQELILKLKPSTILDGFENNIENVESKNENKDITAIFYFQGLSFSINNNTGSYFNDINCINEILNNGVS